MNEFREYMAVAIYLRAWEKNSVPSISRLLQLILKENKEATKRILLGPYGKVYYMAWKVTNKQKYCNWLTKALKQQPKVGFIL